MSSASSRRPVTVPRRHARATALACSVLCAALAGTAQAQIRTDGSVGAPRALSGPAYVIPQTLGKLAGGNLFHSFQVFNVDSGGSATFTTTTPGITNVISRVTGGQASQIDGLLRLSAADGKPGFFFINPAGVTFGAGAAVDVPGAFHVSTADYLAFADGRFHADPQKASSFSSAAPEAFGFLGTGRAAVVLQDGARLRPNPETALGIAAGDVALDNASIASGAGSIRVAAVGQQAVEVGLSGALPELAGRLQLSNGAYILSGSIGARAGTSITLGAGQVDMSDGAYLYSTVDPDGSGAGGPINLAVRGTLRLAGGASISSDTVSAGHAGDIRIRAGEVLIDSGAYLYSNSFPGSGGRSGAIDLVAAAGLHLSDGASISTSTGGDSDGGAIRLQAAEAMIDRAYVLADGFAAGRPGDVVLDIAGPLSLSRGGHVTTATVGPAGAGKVSVHAGSLALTSDAYLASFSFLGGSGRSGDVEVTVAGDAVLSGGASLFTRSETDGDAGAVRLSAASVLLDGGASIKSNASVAGTRGAAQGIEVAADGLLLLRNGSEIDSSTYTDGAAGNVRLRAQDVMVEGGSVVSSKALDGSGAAGTMTVTATRDLLLRDGAALSTTTFTSGDAGAIRVDAASVRMQDGARINSTGVDGSGRAGSIEVAASGAVDLQSGALIVSLAGNRGDGGSVKVTGGSVSLDGGAFLSTSALGAAAGSAGRIEVETAGALVVRNGASITSDNYGPGRAGSIAVSAGDVTLDTSGRISSIAGPGSAADAGRIDMAVRGTLALLGSAGAEAGAGQISTSTLSSGNGGAVNIQAADMLIDGTGAGVSNFAQAGSSGRAGSIVVKLGESLTIRRGGLSSSTGGAGGAGTVEVDAARVLLDGPFAGINAAALSGSGGQTGNVRVAAREAIVLDNGGTVAITNDATVADPATRQATTLSLAAPSIVLRNGATVSADSFGNVAASGIVVTSDGPLSLDRSFITTTANTGDGGPIRVVAGGLLTARRSLIGTSVFGVQGNGGDIDVTARTLLLDSAFIQANTAASNASGGLVRIAADALVASGNTLFLGGDSVYDFRPDLFGFNVIQAAAPTGVSGVVDLVSPVLDLSGSLRVLRADVVDSGGLGRSLCQTSGGSSLALAGRGGLPPSARGLQRAEANDRMPVAAGSSATDAAAVAVLAGPVRSAAARDLRGCL